MNREANSGALICLSEVVDLLKQEAVDHAGEEAGLLAYRALVRIKSSAVAFDVPLPDIGLADTDLDALLAKVSKAA